MAHRSSAWQMVEPSAKLELRHFDPPDPGPGDVLVQVEGCGLCHTDLGFLYGGIRTKHALPLTLGHEIAGRIAAVGPGAALELAGGRAPRVDEPVLVPAVLPCGTCAFCRTARENICLEQKMPGNDIDGGFATHVIVPARYLVPVPKIPTGHELAHLAVVADAVTTPYQALVRAQVAAGDSVVIVGAGGVGIYGVQIAAALGARVLAVDIDEAKLERAREHGAAAVLNTNGLEDDAARKAAFQRAKEIDFPRVGWKVFEMSGTAPGQRLAYSLLTSAGTLGVVGFTRDKVELRLSNLMAFDAQAFGSWGCRPQHYPRVLDLIVEGKIRVKPFVSFHPLSELNSILEAAHHGALETRAVLVPRC